MTAALAPPSRLSLLTIAVVLAVAGPALAQPPPPPPPPPRPTGVQARDLAVEVTGTAVLAGVVVADDGSGQPVRRVTVTARGAAVPSGRLAMTDAEGRFAMSDLPAGSYSITAARPGWVTGFYGARESWSGPGTPVALGDGEARTNLEIRLAPGSVITGRISDQFGQPQAGARVMAVRPRRYGGRDSFSIVISGALTQTTDDRGEYRLYGLPPGEYVVGANVTIPTRTTTSLTTPEEVRWAEQMSLTGVAGIGAPPRHGPAVGYSPVFYPGVTDATAASVVTVGVGEERTGVDFQLQFVPTASVRGTATMPDGQPAQGVTLLMTTSGVQIPLLTLPGLNRATVGRDGRFVFQSVAPGDYFITARASSRPPPARGRGAGPAGPPTMDLWAGANVSVNGSDVEGLEVRMQPGLTLAGRIAFSGTVLDPPERLERVSLRLRPAATVGASVGVAPAEANADGTFAIEGVAPGEYLLTVTIPRVGGPSDPTWVAHRVEIDGRNALEVPFEVFPGRDVEDIVVEFTDRPAELSGRVTDAEGRPVRGLTMVLVRADPETWTGAAGSSYRRTATLDDDGTYTITTPFEGDYYLAALADVAQADLADPAFLEQLAASAVRITLALGDKKVQDLQIGGGTR